MTNSDVKFCLPWTPRPLLLAGWWQNRGSRYFPVLLTCLNSTCSTVWLKCWLFSLSSPHNCTGCCSMLLSQLMTEISIMAEPYNYDIDFLLFTEITVYINAPFKMYNTVDVSIFTRLWKSPIILNIFTTPNEKQKNFPLPFSLALHPYHPLNYLCKSPGATCFSRFIAAHTKSLGRCKQLRPLGWVYLGRKTVSFFQFKVSSINVS